MGSGLRRFQDKLAYGLGALCVGVAIVPLASILFEVVRNGVSALSPQFLTSPPGVFGQAGGGIANAIQGTAILLALASAMAVPFGLLSGVYLAEFGDNKYGRTVRFLNDVLTEFPSIVIGILVYSIIVLAMRGFSTIAGAVALAIIMLPIITRTTEESIKIVPSSIRDAAMALGIRRWRATISVVLSTARSGVITGILLAIARVSGETAPLLLTVLGSQFFFNGLSQPIAALPLTIYRDANLPYAFARQQGWGAALVLILMVLGLNIGVRLATRGRYNSLRSRV
ncbi:MAG: phosphate ABC transporter, permease protein PstA [Crenarchaeota archaeon 13_1_20CM_2_53_14]|nr:MAG: phosphate ABC transporter, permease protein PstA [archaeon 13_2_20CM_2_53_6]OLE58636.1 MAG: phosphate ABC transporter, permease protein PstA [Crenarchaeota archaeon 13_1_20CM_2_53_14]TMI24202.1 MAG: phosphate ABC transporter permease PstA [Candidatus Bathyarchaeota archaeon]